MSLKDRKSVDKLITKWSTYFIISSTLIGSILGSFLIYYFQGEFPYEVLNGGLIATIILTVVEVIKQKRKKNNLPEVDERVIRNIFRFFTYLSHIFLGLLFITLGIFTLLGIESISIFYLWLFFISYIWISGIGSFIIMRK
ncbi:MULTISPECIES: hypothetical protein [Carnobacterium]|uniref:hypothetical protein n=1 Tax=Carnobacterium TaxID=2747 RepID=UPI0030F60943